jgi:hypothetical protein
MDPESIEELPLAERADAYQLAYDELASELERDPQG